MTKLKKLVKADSKTLDITRFFGVDKTKIADGILDFGQNVRVLDGAVASCAASAKTEISPAVSLEGIYTFSDYYDTEYETQVTPEWVYENICHEHLLGYTSRDLAASRIFIADVGESAKSENGYRNIISTSVIDGRTYIFYSATYMLIDERRTCSFSKIGSGYVVQYTSEVSGNENAAATVYSLSQLWLDVVDEDGNIESTLIEASLDLPKVLGSKYKKSTMVSLDNIEFRYVTTEYAPFLGQSYTVNFDRIYLQVYPTVTTDYDILDHFYGKRKCVAKYNNRENLEGAYSSSGEKLILLPDMKLILKSGSKYILEEKSDSMPTLDIALQHFERLYGIHGDTLYISCAGKCTDFTEGFDNLPYTAGKRIVSDCEDFTAMASFGGKVVVFTKQSMMTVKGVDLPFSLSYTGAYGCISQDGLAVCGDGIYFLSNGGVMRYDGSSVKNIGKPLFVKNFDGGCLSSFGGTVVFCPVEGGVYFYDTLSGQWTCDYSFCDALCAGQLLFVKEGDGYNLFRLFSEKGEFSFALLLKNRGRIRISQISVVAKTDFDSHISLTDKNGKELLRIDGVCDAPICKTALLPQNFCDVGKLYFSGYGDVCLYGIRIKYLPLKNDKIGVRNVNC